MTLRGLIIARHRREVAIETDDGLTVRALILGRGLKPLAGDEVLWHEQSDGTVVVDEILPRRTLLERIDKRGRTEGVAANVSLIACVVAPEPAPDWALVDRYLVAAAMLRIRAVLIRNKRDLAGIELDQGLEVYGNIGYAICHTCVPDRRGISDLVSLLRGERSVFVGQSGVGKSSLINALLAAQAQAVGDLSRRRSLGRHTTTASVLHRLPEGGEIIDSPGVRRYAPNVDNPAALENGFIEFRPFLGECRFSDCKHLTEPGCAIRAAVDRRAISAARYRSYIALRATLSSFRSERGKG